MDETPPVTMTIGFCGEETDLQPSDVLTFGRAADLVVDDNPFLHRQLGQVDCRHGIWWLRNLGSRIPLTIKDMTSRSQASLAPGREMALTFPNAAVQFSAGRSNYEVELRLVGSSPPADIAQGSDDDCATIGFAELPLTVDQRRLIVSLAEPSLLTGDPDVDVPANKAAAARLGWTITRFNRKLDNVCERLTKAGVSGLRGQAGVMASDRRSRLVQHSIEAGIVTANDLTLLPSDLLVQSAENGTVS